MSLTPFVPARRMLLLWLAAAAPLLPGVDPRDRRVPVDLDRMPWRSLVRVQTELGARCTGFVVAPRVIATAAHCLYVSRVRRFIQPGSVHVLLRYRAGQYAAHARVLTFQVPAGYDPLREQATAGLDRATLVLDRSLPQADVIGEGDASPEPGAPVRLGGYGQDRDEVPVADPACALRPATTDGQGRALLAHDCEATRGTSGAPLLQQAPDGRWMAIGIQIEAANDAGGGIAVPLATPSGTSADR